MKRDESDSWSLREGDLPRPNQIGTEPLLADLGNNALYRIRLFDFHRDLPTDAARVRHWIIFGALCSFTFLDPVNWTPILFLFFASPLGLLREIGSLPGSPLTLRPKRYALDHWLLGLLPPLLSDLLVTSLEPADYFAAAWGKTLTFSYPSRPCRFYELGIIFVFAGSIAYSLFPSPGMAAFPLAMGLACYQRAMLRFTPYSTLGGLAISIDLTERNLRLTPFRRGLILIGLLGLFIPLMLGLLLGAIGIIYWSYSVLQAKTVTPVAWFVAWQLALLSAGALGWALGLARGRRLRRKAPAIIENKTAILARVIQLKQNQLGEKRPS